MECLPRQEKGVIHTRSEKLLIEVYSKNIYLMEFYFFLTTLGLASRFLAKNPSNEQRTPR